MAEGLIQPAFVRLMAGYNAWQNGSLYAAADGLDDHARRLDRGAFWRSIHGTLSHLLWADTMWLGRFTSSPAPEVKLAGSAAMAEDWDALRDARQALDARLTEWAAGVTADWLAGEVGWYSGAAQRQMRRPAGQLVVHLFNHQTHHRGQVHAMLTAAGARPDDTDLMLMEA